MALGRAAPASQRDLGVGEREEVALVRVQEVGRAGPVALVGQLQRALDLVALRLDPDALAAVVHESSIGHGGRRCRVRRPWSTSTAPSARGATASTRLRRSRSSTPTPTSAPNDPDGFKQTPEELIAALERAGARAVTFPMHEPDGYPGPNDVAMRRGGRSDGGSSRSAASTRTTARSPRRAAAWTRARAGIKLHPRAEQFGWPSRPCATSSRSRTSAGCRSSSTPAAASRRWAGTPSA